MTERKVESRSVHPVEVVLYQPFRAAARVIMSGAMMTTRMNVMMILRSPIEWSLQRFMAAMRRHMMSRVKHMRQRQKRYCVPHKIPPRLHWHALCVPFYVGGSNTTSRRWVGRTLRSATRSRQSEISEGEPGVRQMRS